MTRDFPPEVRRDIDEVWDFIAAVSEWGKKWHDRKGQAQLASQRLSPILKGMEVNFTPEQEGQLAQIAIKAGTNAEHLVKDAVLRLLDDESHSRLPAPELPVWHLGAMGSLHRRDI